MSLPYLINRPDTIVPRRRIGLVDESRTPGCFHQKYRDNSVGVLEHNLKVAGLLKEGLARCDEAVGHCGKSGPDKWPDLKAAWPTRRERTMIREGWKRIRSRRHRRAEEDGGISNGSRKGAPQQGKA